MPQKIKRKPDEVEPATARSAFIKNKRIKTIEKAIAEYLVLDLGVQDDDLPDRMDEMMGRLGL